MAGRGKLRAGRRVCARFTLGAGKSTVQVATASRTAELPPAALFSPGADSTAPLSVNLPVRFRCLGPVMQMQAVSLDDKYELESGRIFVSGIQALVRLPIMQRQRDAAAGLNTAAFISGYRGSPLGGYDVNLWRAQKFLARNHIKFQPGVNEDLAATAVWGSQQSVLFPDAKYDGVTGIWYGKGPGVDRSGDAFKYGSLAGSARYGGVICLAGDDHGCKSSTLPHQSEQAFVHYMMPVLNPTTVEEYLELGLYGIAMSRYSGCWTAFKAISESVETSSSIFLDPLAQNIVTPSDFELPEGGSTFAITMIATIRSGATLTSGCRRLKPLRGPTTLTESNWTARARALASWRLARLI